MEYDFLCNLTVFNKTARQVEKTWSANNDSIFVNKTLLNILVMTSIMYLKRFKKHNRLFIYLAYDSNCQSYLYI